MGFNLTYWTPMGGSYLLLGSKLENFWNFFKKRPFFRVDMAGLGKYHMGGLEVYRVKDRVRGSAQDYP